MATNPNVAVARPMSRNPHVIDAARPITGAPIIRPIANRDRDGGRITSTVIGSAVIRSTIIRSVARVGAISPFTSRCTKGGRNQSQHECGRFQSRFFSILCGNYFGLPTINNVRFHTLSIRITNSLYAPATAERAPGPGQERRGLQSA
jgi:hypothetical protein